MPIGSTSPITVSSTSPSRIFTPSIAPSAARMPQRICAASNAGPAGAAVASASADEPSTISEFVPTSMKRRSAPVERQPGREDPGDDVRADVGAERRERARPAHAGGRATSEVGRGRLAAARRAAIVNGAIDSGSGSIPSASWSIVTLPATTIS